MFSRMEYRKLDDEYELREVLYEDAFSEPLKATPIFTTGETVGLAFICYDDEPDQAILLAHGRPESLEQAYHDIMEHLGPDSESSEAVRCVVFSPDVDELNSLVAGVHSNGIGATINPNLGNWFVGLNQSIRSQIEKGETA